MKTHRYATILTLNYFSQGLLVAVISLIFLDKGLRFSDIAVAMGIYAITVGILELPTGLIADRIGRKRVFLIALIVQTVSCIILILGHGAFAVFSGMFFFGAGRAFASGSFEALFIDRYTDAYGACVMSRAVRILSVSEAAGLAAGALLGGFLPVFASQYLSFLSSVYDIDLIMRFGFSFVLIILAQVWIPTDKPENTVCDLSISTQFKDSVLVIQKSKNMKYLLISVVATGFALCVLEAYWRPQLLDLFGGGALNTGPLGILSVLYLLSVMIGNMLSAKIIDRHIEYAKTIYLICRIAMGAALLLLLMQASIFGFFVAYCTFYFFFGCANIVESTLINADTPNRYRASVLSTQSLIGQIGILSASVFSKLMIDHTSVHFLWFTAALVLIVLTLPSLKITSIESFAE